MSKAFILYLEVIFVLGLPLFFMGASPLILSARPILLAIGGFYCLGVLRYYRARYADIGLTCHNFSVSLTHLVTPSLVTIAVVLLIFTFVPTSTGLWFIGVDPLSLPTLTFRLIFYIFGSVPMQELMFRGYFTYRLERVFRSKIWIMVLSTLVFTLSHVPFKSPIMLVVGLMLGVFYILNYLKYRNLYSILVSHAAIGAILILVRNYYLPYT